MVITPYLPHSRVGHGGGSAVRDLVKHLAMDHEVLLVSLVRPGEEDLISSVENLGVRVAALPFDDSDTQGLGRLRMMGSRALATARSLFSGFPSYVEKYWLKNLSRQIIALTREFHPDAIQIEYLQMSLYARDLVREYAMGDGLKPNIIINSHELGSVPRHRRANHAGNAGQRWWFRLEARRWEKLQLAACRWAHRMLCVTEDDRLVFEALGGTKLLTVPLGMDLEVLQTERQPTSPPCCLFVGSFNHRPNVLAADLLIQQIWPQVLAQRPDVRLILAGRGSQSHLQTSAGGTTGVKAVGFVDDLTPLFSQCSLFVAPLPEGGGIKIKILEAMARGIPVVTTPVGAEGITQPDQETMVITDAHQGFAQAVLKALDDPQSELRAKRARRHMEENFAWKAIAQRLVGIYRDEE